MIEKQKVAESFDRAALTYDQWITIQKNIGDNLFVQMQHNYLKDGLLPVTYEVIYGHALGKQIVTDTSVIHFHPH